MSKKNPETKGTNSEPEGKKPRNVSPVWSTLSKSRRVFNAQLTKSNKIKFDCLQKYAKAAALDEEKFWIDYKEEMDKLLDSRKYNAECKSLDVDPEILAEHIVFLGKTIVSKVLKNGVEATLGERDIKELYCKSFILKSSEKQSNAPKE